MSGKTDFDLKDEAAVQVASLCAQVIERMLQTYTTMYPESALTLLERSEGLSFRRVWIKERPKWFVEFTITYDRVIMAWSRAIPGPPN